MKRFRSGVKKTGFLEAQALGKRKQARRSLEILTLESRIVLSTSPTMTTLSASAATIPAGQTLTITANVMDRNDDTITGGTVTFKDGTSTLATVALTNNSASWAVSTLATGQHDLTANYSGYQAYRPSGTGVSPTGIIRTVAGTGTAGYTGDGGQANDATLNNPISTAVDAAGDLFITDYSNNTIRKVTPEGLISTFAGNGTNGYGGDGDAATSAQIGRPGGLAVNAAGDLFIDELIGPAIREVTTDGVIHTVAGGSYGYSGDGGLATSASLSNPSDVAVNANGDLFIADSTNQVIREVTPDGIIHTFAGDHNDGTAGYTGDGGPATSAELGYPTGVAVDSDGDVFIADHDNHVVREVTPDGIIHTVAGNGTAGYSGDGGPATSAKLSATSSVAVDASGDLFIVDPTDNVVREVTLDGIIHTVAGSGSAGFTGDGGAATSATLNGPAKLSIDNLGDLMIPDSSNNVVREVMAGLSVSVTPALATHFTVTGVPANVTAGTPQTITVTALSSNGSVATGYTGLVAITSNDSSAVLPPDATLTQGVGTFVVTLETAGVDSITAADAQESELTGTESGITVEAAFASQFVVSGAVNETAGGVESITFTAKDAFGNVATGYTGLVKINSSDGKAVLPSDSILTNGTGTFAVTLETDGYQSITATDTVNPALTGNQSGILVITGEVSQIVVTSSSNTSVAGSPLVVTVEAEDQFGNLEPEGEFGLDVHFTSSDGQAVLPSDGYFYGGLNSSTIALKTVGTQSITVTDIDAPNVTGTEMGIDVTSGAATHFAVVPVVGMPNTYTVTAIDAYGNVASGYAGTVVLTSDDPSAVLPPAVSLTGGVGTVRVVLETPGTHSITAADPLNPDLTGMASSVATLILTGTVYVDTNVDGVYQLGEPGLANRIVFLDLNGDGTRDPGDPTATTDAFGHYSLGGGAAGDYLLLEETSQDDTSRYVKDRAALAYGGTENIGVVPVSPVAPVQVIPDPFAAGMGSEPNFAFVQALYQVVLGRVGADDEVQSWDDQMTSGETRQGVAHDFVNSSEHRQDEVMAFYRDFLHRATDPFAIVWVNQLLAGVSEETVAAEILDSPEYQASSHGDSTTFVDNLYLDVLGREGDTAGVAGWEAELTSGADRAAVIASFVNSAEAIDQVVEGFYSAYLHRQPEAGTSSYWASMLGTVGGSVSDVAIGILGGSEFDDDVLKG